MKNNQRQQNHPKTTLRLLDLDQAKAAVLANLRSPGSRRCYEHAIVGFIAWYCSEPRLGFNKAVVTRYRMHLESRRLTPEPSTSDLLLFGGWHMKPLTPGC
jgi:hypothetical protein